MQQFNSSMARTPPQTPMNYQDPQQVMLLFQQFLQFNQTFHGGQGIQSYQSTSNQMQTPQTLREEERDEVAHEKEQPMVGSNKRKNKSTDQNCPSAHRHFNIEPSSLSLKDFKIKLAVKLSESVMEYQLLKNFPLLHDFRKTFVLPLKEKYPLEKEIDLKDNDENSMRFLDAFKTLFVKGCHVKREPRRKGIKAVPDKSERIMFRNLIKDLWEILGLRFLYISFYNNSIFVISFRLRC